MPPMEDSRAKRSSSSSMFSIRNQTAFRVTRARCHEENFFQASPRLGNGYIDDRVLRSLLRSNIVGPVLAEIEPGLRRLGARACR